MKHLKLYDPVVNNLFTRWQVSATQAELDELADELLTMPVVVVMKLLIAVNETTDGAWESFALVRLINQRAEIKGDENGCGQHN